MQQRIHNERIEEMEGYTVKGNFKALENTGNVIIIFKELLLKIKQVLKIIFCAVLIIS